MSTELLRHDLGVSWVVPEPLERASHALLADGRVWFVDPVDDPVAVEAAAALGEPAGVLQLLDRHGRDGAALAERLGIPLLRVPDAVPSFEVVSSGVWIPRWSEVALWWPDRKALVVAEVLGTSAHYTLGAGEVGIHPLLRASPPGRLRSYPAEHLLVGHGAPLHGAGVADAIERAYARSRRDLPRMLLTLPRLGRAANQAAR